MTTIDMHRAHILREATNRAFKGENIHDIVGALEMVIVDVLTALPGMNATSTTASFDAMAADVRAIIAERFAAKRSAH